MIHPCYKKHNLVKLCSNYKNIIVQCYNCNNDNSIIDCGILEDTSNSLSIDYNYSEKSFIDKPFFCQTCFIFLNDIKKLNTIYYKQTFIDILNKSKILCNK